MIPCVIAYYLILFVSILCNNASQDADAAGAAGNP